MSTVYQYVCRIELDDLLIAITRFEPTEDRPDYYTICDQCGVDYINEGYDVSIYKKTPTAKSTTTAYVTRNLEHKKSVSAA